MKCCSARIRIEERRKLFLPWKNKNPFRRAGRGLKLQRSLELVDDVGGDGVPVAAVGGARATEGVEIIQGVVPADFETADDVFPEVALNRAGQREILLAKAEREPK